MHIFIILSWICGLASMMDVVLEKFQMEYVSPTFYNALNVSIGRLGRYKPYYANFHIDYKQYAGDNLTMRANVYEVISGRNILTPLRFEYTLCYFLSQDSFVGKMIREQIPSNLRCPFAPAVVDIKNLTFHAESLPPVTFRAFTYASLFVRLCVEIEFLYVKQRIVFAKLYGTVNMKLNDKHRSSKKQS